MFQPGNGETIVFPGVALVFSPDVWTVSSAILYTEVLNDFKVSEFENS